MIIIIIFWLKVLFILVSKSSLLDKLLKSYLCNEEILKLMQ